MLPGASKCHICSETTHSSRDCPCLHSPLKDGFYSGGGGGGGHSHDEDDGERQHLEENEKQSFYSFSLFFKQKQTQKQSRCVEDIPKTVLPHTLFQKYLA
jgi:hypothetical protein